MGLTPHVVYYHMVARWLEPDRISVVRKGVFPPTVHHDEPPRSMSSAFAIIIMERWPHKTYFRSTFDFRVWFPRRVMQFASISCDVMHRAADFRWEIAIFSRWWPRNSNYLPGAHDGKTREDPHWATHTYRVELGIEEYYPSSRSQIPVALWVVSAIFFRESKEHSSSTSSTV